jgi:hypothetical protein
MFTDKEEIKKWLVEIEVEKYRINEDLSVDVKGLVDFSHKNLKNIPVKFNDVDGSFYCNGNQLTSLLGSPRSVSGQFSCGGNLLINYQYMPEYIGDSFFCSGKISLDDLIYTEFEGDFIHQYRNVQDKIESFSSLYQKKEDRHISYYQAYVPLSSFEEVINILKEKQLLDKSIHDNYLTQNKNKI